VNQDYEKRNVLLFCDGIRYSIEMARMAYTRLSDTLLTLSTYYLKPDLPGEEMPFLTLSATADAWSIVDCVNRLRNLLGRTPGLKQKSPQLQLFFRKTKDVDELRNSIQHLEGEIAGQYSQQKLFAWGVLSWLVPKGPESCLVLQLCPGTFVEGIRPLVNPVGRLLRQPIDHITLFGVKSLCISGLIEDVNTIAGWLGQQSPKFFAGKLPGVFMGLTASAAGPAGDRVAPGDVLGIAVGSQPAGKGHITRWRSYTCDCILEYNGELQLTRIVRVCQKHAHLSGQTLLEEVMKENRDKGT